MVRLGRGRWHNLMDMKSSPTVPAEVESGDLLLKAITVTAALTPGQVIVPGVEGWGSLAPTGRSKVVLHPSYQPHAHAIDELCLLMSGSAAMLVGEQTLRMRAPTLMILRANVFHGEGSVDHEPYELLWLGLDTSGACVVAVSTYRPKRGWRVGGRQRMGQWSGKHILHSVGSATTSGQSADERSLAGAGAGSASASGGEALRPGHWPRVQNELLAALVALRGQAVAEKNAPVDSQATKHADTVGDIQRYLASHLAQPLRLDDIAHLVRLSPNHINAVFREHTGQTIHAWLIGERMKKSMSLCTETDMPFKDIAAAVGFQNALYFSRAFRRTFDMSPTQARNAPRKVSAVS